MTSVLVLGLCWAGLYASLATGGHAPSFTRGLPVPAADYYRVAALYVVPLVCLVAWLFARVAQSVAGVTGAREDLMRAYARPTVVLFITPDLLTYAAFGHASMGSVVRFTAPLTGVVVAVLSIAVLKRAGAASPRAEGAALFALVVQAIPTGLLLR